MVLPVSLLHAALPTKSDVAGPTSFAGQLLVAAPELRQAAFDHAVILLAQHSHEGALGIVINRPGATRPIAGLLSGFHADTGRVAGGVRVFFGGPVDPNFGLVLHSTEYNRAETIDIDGRVAMTVAPAVLRDIGLGKGPHKSLVAFGYAGWCRRSSRTNWRTARGSWCRRIRASFSTTTAPMSGPRQWRGTRRCGRAQSLQIESVVALRNSWSMIFS